MRTTMLISLLAALTWGCLEEGAAAKGGSGGDVAGGAGGTGGAGNTGAGGEGGAPQGGEGGEGGGAPVGDRGAYPSSNIGKTEGMTLENLSFPLGEDETFQIADIYDDAANKVLLVTTSAGWCSACIEEQPKLAQLHEEYAARGLFILITLFENADFAPADIRLAQSWKRRYELPFTVVADPDFQFSDYYDRDATPMTMLVDVENMLILKIATGFNEPEVRAIIEAVIN